MNAQAFTYSDGTHVTAGGIVREGYARHSGTIDTARELAASLRAGPYAWPGGYAIVYIVDDGELLCPPCVRNEYVSCVDAIRQRSNNGWRVIATATAETFEDGECCAHCGMPIADL